jgi:hypothetical protein
MLGLDAGVKYRYDAVADADPLFNPASKAMSPP